MHDSTLDVGLESHQLWWTMLLHRTLSLARALPSQLRGTISFEVATENGATACFHLLLAGARTSGGDGSIATADTLVKTTDAKLHALMFAPAPPADALSVSGDARLFSALLEFLKDSAAPKSLLQVRCQP
jgi:hypothetical protein